MIDRARLLAEISADLGRTSNDELAAFHRFITRVMGKGRDSYGPTFLDNDGRDFRKEAEEEVLDLSWYLSLRLVRADRADEQPISEVESKR